MLLLDDIDKVAKWLGKYIGFSSGWLVAIAIIVYILLNPDKSLFWQAKIASLFSWASSKARKKAISSDIRSRVLKISKNISSENNEILPYDLKVEWVKEESRETFLKKNQVIVRMSQKSNPHRNFMYAVTEFVKQGFMPKARKYIDPKLLQASDLTVIRKMLEIGYHEAIDYFDCELLNPIASADSEIDELLNNIQRIDENGMFMPILINEFSKIGRRIYPERPDECLIAESKEFLRFLNTIASKRPGEDVDLEFNREYFKVAISLAARDDTLLYRGIRVYINQVLRELNQGIETIYVFGLGQKRKVARQVAESAKEHIRVFDTKDHSYKHKSSDGWRVKGLCVEIITSAKSDEVEDAI